jgi:hypothetical protein
MEELLTGSKLLDETDEELLSGVGMEELLGCSELELVTISE